MTWVFVRPCASLPVVSHGLLARAPEPLTKSATVRRTLCQPDSVSGGCGERTTPLVPIDNSPTSASFRNVAKLRRNMLFAGSTEEADCA